jgi:hypothetical protein
VRSETWSLTFFAGALPTGFALVVHEMNLPKETGEYSLLLTAEVKLHGLEFAVPDTFEL